MQQIAVRIVNLDDSKPGGDGAFRGSHECHDYVDDARLVQFLRERVSVIKGNRAGRDHGPAAIIRRQARAPLKGRSTARLAARVRELDPDLRRLRMRKVDYPLERRDLRIRPKPRVLG